MRRNTLLLGIGLLLVVPLILASSAPTLPFASQPPASGQRSAPEPSGSEIQPCLPTAWEIETVDPAFGAGPGLLHS